MSVIQEKNFANKAKIKNGLRSVAEYYIVCRDIVIGVSDIMRIFDKLQNENNKVAVLTEAWKENLAQWRHIEIERLTFLSLEFIGTCTLIAAPFKNYLFKFIICCLLILCNIVCSYLLYRWSKVYKDHQDIAEDLKKELKIYTGSVELYRLPDNKKHSPTARAFMFFNILVYPIIIAQIILVCFPKIAPNILLCIEKCIST
jgi:hypothetical protein